VGTAVWVSVLVAYLAPAAVDWRGPWTRGEIVASKNFYRSEAACKKETEAAIARMHQDMKAPVLYRCVQFPESLP